MTKDGLQSMDRAGQLERLLRERIVIIDGAMGTMIQTHKLDEAAFRGERFRDWQRDLKGNNDLLNLTRPDVIKCIHRQYLEAGADIIETNTFGGAPVALADNHLDDRAHELNFAAAKLAREIADQYSTGAKPRFVAGSMGPTNKDLNITATATFEQLRDGYYTQAKGLVEGGADFLLVETCFDTGSLKAALIAIDQLRRDLGLEIPAVASVTIERSGTMLGGQPVDALYASIANQDLLAVGACRCCTVNVLACPSLSKTKRSLPAASPHSGPLRQPGSCVVVRYEGVEAVKTVTVVCADVSGT